MNDEIIHQSPVFKETEIRCDGCDVLIGINQWTDEEFVNSKCKECNQETEGVLTIYCLKCRMEKS